jgi:hypothetical protein
VLRRLTVEFPHYTSARETLKQVSGG